MTYHEGEFTPKDNINAYGDAREADVEEYDALYGHKCEPPPDAVFCFVMGLGFLILEILVPLVILFLLLKPLKPAIFASVRVGFEVAKDATSGVIQIFEGLLSVPRWAGIRYAWIVVVVIGTFFAVGMGQLLLGAPGFLIGGLLGVTSSALLIFLSIGFTSSKIIKGPSPAQVTSLWAALGGVVVGFSYLVGARFDGSMTVGS